MPEPTPAQPPPGPDVRQVWDRDGDRWWRCNFDWDDRDIWTDEDRDYIYTWTQLVQNHGPVTLPPPPASEPSTSARLAEVTRQLDQARAEAARVTEVCEQRVNLANQRRDAAFAALRELRAERDQLVDALAAAAADVDRLRVQLRQSMPIPPVGGGSITYKPGS